MQYFNKPSKVFLLLANVSIAMIGFTQTGNAGPAEDFQTAEITKRLHELRKKPADARNCLIIFRDIDRVNAIAHKKYFSDKEIEYFTENCKPESSNTPAKPKAPPVPIKKATQTRQPLPKASESSDSKTKVTSALETLIQEPVTTKNCEQRVALISTFDKLSEIEGKPSYSMLERKHFLEACYSLLPEAKPLTHKAPRLLEPKGFMGELQKKIQQNQDHQKQIQDSKEARQDLDNLLDELVAEKAAR
jgi:hypothetical protein